MNIRDWCIVIVLASTGTFIGMAFSVVSPVLPLIIEHFGGAAQGALIGQWILTMPSIGVIVGGPTTGWVVERIGARRVLFSSFAIFAIAGAAGLVVDNPFALLGTRLIVGLAATGQVTAAMTLIGELYSDARRGSVLGLQNGIATTLVVIATLAAGALGQSQGWRAPFELYSVSLVTLLLGIFVIPATARTRAREADGGGISAFKPLLPLYGMVIITFILSFFTAAAVPQLLAIDGIASPQIISIVIGVGTILFVVGAVFYGAIRQNVGFVWTFAMGFGLQGAGVLWIAFAHGDIGIGLGVALLNLGSGIQTPNLSHLVLDHAPVAIRGRAVGLLFSAQFLGPFLNSSILAPAMSQFGMRNTMAAVGGLVVMAAAALALRAHLGRHSRVVAEGLAGVGVADDARGFGHSDAQG